MKYLAIITFAIFTFGFGMAKADPKIEVVGGDTYNWGVVKPSQSPLKAKIVIKNVGTDTLKITEVRPGCSCTSSPISKKEVAPKDTASMMVTLNVGSTKGDVTKSVKVVSNDPTNGTMYVFLKANVFYPISYGPYQYFVFNDLQVGKESTSKLTITNNTEDSITLSNFELSPDIFVLNVMGKKVLGPKESFEFVLKCVPQKTGIMNGNLKFSTSDPEAKQMHIQIYGTVKESQINVSPAGK